MNTPQLNLFERNIPKEFDVFAAIISEIHNPNMQPFTIGTDGVVSVLLSEKEMQEVKEYTNHVYVVSKKDNLNAQKRARPERTEAELYADSLRGYTAEWAVAKAIGIPHPRNCGTFHKYPDVGRFDVRSIALASNRLLIRDHDVLDRQYILGYVQDNLVHLVGWMFGHEARQEKYLWGDLNKNRGVWFVPRKDLYNMTLLREFGGTE